MNSDSIINILIQKGFHDLRIQHGIRKNLIKELKSLNEVLKKLQNNESDQEEMEGIEFVLLATLDRFLEVKFPANPDYNIRENVTFRNALLAELVQIEKEANPIVETPEFAMTSDGINKAIKRLFAKSSSISSKSRAADFLVHMWSKGYAVPRWDSDTGKI